MEGLGRERGILGGSEVGLRTGGRGMSGGQKVGKGGGRGEGLGAGRDTT